MNEPSRLLTTHAGSLPRPHGLLELYAAGSAAAEIDEALSDAVAGVIRKQLETGIDIVDDGEFGKPTEGTATGYGHGTWLRYARARLAGCDWVDAADLPPAQLPPVSRDHQLFPEYYRERVTGDDGAAGRGQPTRKWACTAPIEYVGDGAVQRDIEVLKKGIGDLAVADAFVSVASPASVALTIANAYYGSEEEFLAALGDAMRHEVKAIVDAGLAVQIDDPVVVGNWDYWQGDINGYRRYAAERVELLNAALAGIPPERVRYHVCWGSWQGPHSTDLPLRDIVDVLLSVNAKGLCLECANVRHEHEWQVWEDTRLPDGKVLIPGVVSHKTAVLEHPELVAERLVRYARCVGPENVIAGTDCGLGGRLSDDLVWAKLAVLSQGAQLATQALWPR
jgi:5-methyltetrahydropteroyltriglutamate--homocysteine methyltransferase